MKEFSNRLKHIPKDELDSLCDKASSSNADHISKLQDYIKALEDKVQEQDSTIRVQE